MVTIGRARSIYIAPLQENYSDALTEGETLLNSIQYSRLHDSKGPIITVGRNILCMIGQWSFHSKKITCMTGLSVASCL